MLITELYSGILCLAQHKSHVVISGKKYDDPSCWKVDFPE